MESAKYKKEIPDCGWISEVIDETFDGVLDSLTPSSIVYGGVLRDVIAGMNLEGDLDIAVNSSGFRNLYKVFETHPKWIVEKSKESWAKELASYKRPKYALPNPVEEIALFKNPSSRKLQIIQSCNRSQSVDPLEIATNLARNVDLICCGLIMENDGRVYEVVPDAAEHCRKRILKVNHFGLITKFDNIKERVDKLVARGWKLRFDVDKEKVKLEEKLKEFEKTEKDKNSDLRGRRAGPSKEWESAVRHWSKSKEKHSNKTICIDYTDGSSHSTPSRTFTGEQVAKETVMFKIPASSVSLVLNTERGNELHFKIREMPGIDKVKVPISEEEKQWLINNTTDASADTDLQPYIHQLLIGG